MKQCAKKFEMVLQGTRRRAWRLTAGVLLAGGLAGCQTVNTTQGGAVGVERKQMMMVSSQEMEQAASQNYRQVLQKAASQGALDRNPAQVERVRTVAARLIPVTGVFRPDAPRWKWEVHVISSKELNAWCMAGGKIAFYSGIIEGLQLSDDEMAAVMGHEIAHALREHSREQASEQMVTNLGVNVLGAVLGVDSSGLGKLAQLGIGLPHSRAHETEADRMGVELAARAGYDPRAAIGLWQKMARAGGGQGPEWMSTHPSTQSRIEDLRVYAARVLPLYEQAATQHARPVK